MTVWVTRVMIPTRMVIRDSRSRALESKLALDRFLAATERRAFRIALIATRGNRDDAFDIVQDAMFKLVEKYSDKDEQEWAPLFHRILQSRINDWYRRNAVRRRFKGWLPGLLDEDQGEDPFQTTVDESGRSPEQQLLTSQAMGRLEQAIAELPPRQQQAFLLRTWEGLDVKQTARAMACAEGSVKTHYSRAVHALRDKLGGHWQ